ncbi:MAG: hypothetical protein U0641_11180 [Anaerolineae bacterium]
MRRWLVWPLSLAAFLALALARPGVAQTSRPAHGLEVGCREEGASAARRASRPRGDESWTSVADGVNDTVFALAILGADLYVGGQFQEMSDETGTTEVDFIAKWNGKTWESLGDGVNERVWAITPDGQTILVGGWFTEVSDEQGVHTVNHIARWNGAQWSPIGGGVDGGVAAIAVSGSDIYVGGFFSHAIDSSGEKVAAHNIAKWDGRAWSPLGGGLGGEASSYVSVSSIAVSGADVYVGGAFTTAADADGVKSVNNIARWDGSHWAALGGGANDYVYAVAAQGPDVYVGGQFTSVAGAAGTTPAKGIARWTDKGWQTVGDGLTFGIAPGRVYALKADRDSVYVGGDFTETLDRAGVKNANFIARWDGGAWRPLGDGVNSSVMALATRGVTVYAGGSFNAAGEQEAKCVARFRPAGLFGDYGLYLSAIAADAGK